MEKLMWYRTPTQDYMEGLPLGNGRLAAMALGTPERFRLALNHEWLWRGETGCATLTMYTNISVRCGSCCWRAGLPRARAWPTTTSAAEAA